MASLTKEGEIMPSLRSNSSSFEDEDEALVNIGGDGEPAVAAMIRCVSCGRSEVSRLTCIWLNRTDVR